MLEFLLIFSNMLGRKMASGKMLDILPFGLRWFCFLLLLFFWFFVLIFLNYFFLWTAMNIRHLHSCLMEPLLPRETNSVKLVCSINLGINQNKWFLVCA